MKKRRKAKLGEIAHRWLVPVTGVLFLIVGGAKLIGVFGDATILKWPDPVLRLPGWLLMSTAGIVEVVVGSLCVLGKDRLFPCAVVAVVGGWFDFVSGDGLTFRGEVAVSMFRAGC